VKNKIIKALKKFDEISDWTLNINHKVKKELYLIFSQPESIREIDIKDYQVRIFINQAQEGQLFTGSASVSILPDTSSDQIENKISEAVFAAKLALNPRYSIAKNTRKKVDYEVCDSNLLHNLDHTLENVRKTLIKAVEGESDIKMASAEIMLMINNRNFITSKGLNESHCDSEILLELVLLSGAGESESETFTLREERLLDVLNIEDIVKRYADYTRNNVRAILPKTGQYSIILTEESLDEFFYYYAYQASAEALFNKSSRFEVGKPVVASPRGELLNLAYDPSLRGGSKSSNYDQYGLPLEKIQVIENGILKTVQADNRYGSYLNIPINGSATNIVVAPGGKSFQGLLEDNCYIFSRFSSFNPDPITGAFSGEVRNGLCYRNQQFVPVKGGSVTGVMDQAMQEVWFSSETIQRGNYFGPKYIKFSNIDVTG